MKTNTSKKGLLLYLLLFLFSSILQSCCKQKYKLSGIYNFYGISSLEPNSGQNGISDTIRSEFYLGVSFETQMAALNFQLINSAYATTCEANLVNKVVEEDIQLICNKSFVYKGDTIIPGTDILTLQHIDFSYDEGDSNTPPLLLIHFNTDFIDKASFDSSLYSFKVSIPTDNGLMFEKEKELLMMLH